VAWGYNFRQTRIEVRGSRFENQGQVRGSGFEAEGELFDDRVGEDLAGDALDLELGRGGTGCERVLEGEEEVLSLADIGDPVQAHAAERSGDGLALGIEDGALQRDIDMGFHGSDYRLAAGLLERREARVCAGRDGFGRTREETRGEFERGTQAEGLPLEIERAASGGGPLHWLKILEPTETLL